MSTYIRSDSGSELNATKVRDWLARIGVKTLFIEPGSPWEIGYIESFNGKLRDELLAREQFDTLLEAKVLIERSRRDFKPFRPHSSSAIALRRQNRSSLLRSLQAGVGTCPTQIYLLILYPKSGHAYA